MRCLLRYEDVVFRPQKSWPSDVNGHSGLEAFLVFESQGLIIPSTEPELVERLLSGKRVLEITVDQWVDSILEGTLTVWELVEYCENTPKGTLDNVISSIRRKLELEGNYCPKIFRNKKCFYEQLRS